MEPFYEPCIIRTGFLGFDSHTHDWHSTTRMDSLSDFADFYISDVKGESLKFTLKDVFVIGNT